MENLALQEKRGPNLNVTLTPPKEYQLDEGYLILKQGLTSHLSRSPYQEYFFRDSSRLESEDS